MSACLFGEYCVSFCVELGSLYLLFLILQQVSKCQVNFRFFFCSLSSHCKKGSVGPTNLCLLNAKVHIRKIFAFQQYKEPVMNYGREGLEGKLKIFNKIS